MPKKRRKKRKSSVSTGFTSVPVGTVNPFESGYSDPFKSVFKQAAQRNAAVRQAYRTELSIIDYRTLAWQASESNPMAYEYLVKENRRLSRLANSRLRALEKAGLDMFAYDRATTYLKNQGKKRFSAKFADQSDYVGMVNQISELVAFVNSRSSTVAEARAMLQRKLEKISEHTGTTYTEEQGYRLGRLLSNDSISTLLRDVKADSDEVLELLEEISMNDFNEERLASIVDRYLMGYDPWNVNLDYLNYDELMDAIREERDRLKGEE